MATDKELYNLQISTQKALNSMEAPLKGKHARAAIISTFQSGECSTLWEMMKRQPLMEHRFTAWKFCHLVHKVLREGHNSVIKTSYFNKNLISQIGKMWKHLNDGVGICIDLYCNLLVTKIEFHMKNTSVPGNLILDFNELEKFSQSDINYYFELGVEVFDYLDDIISLENRIFENINMFRMSCMTPQGQCRLAPVIPLIQDSNQLYDLMIRLMFKLHSKLPNDVLQGHRERFKTIFTKLKEFYGRVRPLPYFQDLIKVPVLPETSPNFSSNVDFGSYVPPVVIVPENEPTELDVQELVDTTILEKPINIDEIENRIRNEYYQILQEKELLIRNLQEEIRGIQRFHIQACNEYKMEIESLNERHNNVCRENEILTSDNNILKAKLNSTISMEGKLEDEENKNKTIEEKYSKMKNLYSQLREEHITLLRKNGDTVKQIGSFKGELEQVNMKNEYLETQLEEHKQKHHDYDEIKTTFIQKENENNVLLTELGSLNIKSENLLKTIDEFQKEKDKLKLEFENQIKELSTQNEFISKNNDRISTESQQRTEEITSLRETNCEQEKTIVELSNILEQEKESTRIIEAKYAEEHLRRKDLENHLEIEKQTKIELSKTIQSVQSLNSDLENDFKLLKLELDDKIKKLSSELESNINIHDKIEIEKQVKIEENESLQKKVQALEDSILSVQFNLEQEKQTSQDYKNSIDKEILEKNQIQDKLLLEKTKNNDLVTDLACSIQKSSKLQTIIENLQGKNDEFLKSVFKKIIELSLKIISRKEKDFILVLEEMDSTINMISPIDATLSVNESERLEFMEHLLTLSHLFGTLRINCSNICNDYSNADIIINNFENSSELCANTIKLIKQTSSSKEIQENLDKLKQSIQLIITLIRNDENKVQMVEILENELESMDKAIIEASNRISDILAKSRSKHEGLTLEVNERILDSCTELIKAIMELVKSSKALQHEIVLIGKGSSTAKEFYKRNNKWTDGLISAAKNVGVGANLLVEAANKCITNDSKFHLDIIVAAQEIAASTAQLVVASKVKASRDSKNLSLLSNASKGVTHATAAVVATTRDCTQRLETYDDFDFTKLTVHQAKTLEMEIQIKVLELEQSLETQRMKLSAFRKSNYNARD